MAELTCTTAGESHGRHLTAVVSGLPSGMPVCQSFLDAQLARRQMGRGRSPRQRVERDRADVSAGIRHGHTLGSPVVISVANRDHDNWQHAMSVWPTDGQQGNWRDRVITLPRPGHADLPGIARGGFDGLREVLERSSARETAARVAGCALGQQLLAHLGVRVRAHVVACGSVALDEQTRVRMLDEQQVDWQRLDASHTRCCDGEADARMAAEIDAAQADRDTLGGLVEIIVWGVPPGIGGYTTTAERLDGRLAGAVLSVQAMKAVEFGDGMQLAGARGSLAHDEIFPFDGRQPERLDVPAGALGGDQGMGVTRTTVHAGGIEGGMSNGGPMVLRVAMKPLPTLMRPLASVDLASGAAAPAHAERSDACAIAAASIVLESVVSFELARVLREQFGQPAFTDLQGAWNQYLERVRYPRRAPIDLPQFDDQVPEPA